jgi:nitrate/nitrite transporter NarK
VTVLVGALGCVLTAYAQSPLALTVAITLSAVGLLSAIPVFWAFPTALLGGTAAAAGIALVAAIGNLGGFAGPAFTGISEDATGGFEMPLTVLAGLLVLGAALIWLVREQRAPAATSRSATPAPAAPGPPGRR